MIASCFTGRGRNRGGLFIGPAFVAPAGLLFATLLGGCSQTDGIDPEGATFDGISPEASITLTGTEPFWSVVIEPGAADSYTARLTTPENSEGTAFSVTRFAGNNGLGFSGEFDAAPVQIAITPGECSDGMSDRTYPFAATVTLSDETLRGCGYTSEAPFDGPQSP